MKQNNNNRRARGRGPRKPHGMGGGGHNKGPSYDGGGQELRVRGNAYQVLEKYLQLARDAGAAGDRVAAENFLQHADHRSEGHTSELQSPYVISYAVFCL